MGDILDCGTRLYVVRAFGVREELYRTLRLRIRIRVRENGSHDLAIFDHDDNIRRTMSIDSDVTGYVIKKLSVHEILLKEDDDIIVKLDRSDANFLLYCDAIEEITKSAGIFCCVHSVKDSDGNSSESDVEVGPPGAMAAPRGPRTQMTWDCHSCHQANRRDQMQCGECLRNRTGAWKCSCSKVYRLEKLSCTRCDIWRCQRCSFLNEATSPDRCYGCGYSRIP